MDNVESTVSALQRKTTSGSVTAHRWETLETFLDEYHMFVASWYFRKPTSDGTVWEVGDRAPEFHLYNTENQRVSMYNFIAHSDVDLLLLPLASTDVCKTQLCSLRDNIAKYSRLEWENDILKDTLLPFLDPKNQVFRVRLFHCWWNTQVSSNECEIMKKFSLLFRIFKKWTLDTP